MGIAVASLWMQLSEIARRHWVRG